MPLSHSKNFLPTTNFYTIVNCNIWKLFVENFIKNNLFEIELRDNKFCGENSLVERRWINFIFGTIDVSKLKPLFSSSAFYCLKSTQQIRDETGITIIWLARDWINNLERCVYWWLEKNTIKCKRERVREREGHAIPQWIKVSFLQLKL